MNKDTLDRLRETVLVPHGDPQLVLYTKLVVGLLWLVHLPLGFLYGAPLPFYLLLGGMMLLDGVNLFLSRRSASRAWELGAALAFLVGSALLFQKAYVVFPADILLFLHLRAGPRGRHFYQPSELSLGDGLPARRAHPRPRRPLRRELRAPFPVPLHLHPRGGLHHHVLHPALLGGQGQTPSFIAAAHRRGEGQTLGDVAEGHHGHVQRPQLQDPRNRPPLPADCGADAGDGPPDGSG